MGQWLGALPEGASQLKFHAQVIKLFQELCLEFSCCLQVFKEIRGTAQPLAQKSTHPAMCPALHCPENLGKIPLSLFCIILPESRSFSPCFGPKLQLLEIRKQVHHPPSKEKQPT